MHERRRRKLATKFIGILQEGITEQVSHSTLQKILEDYYVADRNITNLIKIQNENRREIKWQRKKK